MRTLMLVPMCFFAVFQNSFAQQQEAPAAAGTSAPALSLPSTLSGRWYTPDRHYTQEWKIEKMNLATKTGSLSYWSTRSKCSMTGVPATIDYDGTTLTILSTDRLMPCTSKFAATLTRQGNGEFHGTLEVGISGNYPHLVTVVK